MHPRLRAALVAMNLFSICFGSPVQVSVSGDGFGPSNIKASVGQLIEINFDVGSATFTQSSLDHPCVPSGGIDSGIITIPPGQAPKQFSFTLQTLDPLFFFNFVDKTPEKCTAGFVATINASAQQIEQFIANTKNANGLQQPPPTQTIITVSAVRPTVAPSTPKTSIAPTPTLSVFEQAIDATETDRALQGASIATPDPPSDESSQSSSITSPLPISTSPGPSESSIVLTSTSIRSHSFLPTETSRTPGQIPQPTSTAFSTTRVTKTKTVVVAIGVLLGVTTFLTSVAIFVVVKRRRGRAAVLPQAHSPTHHDVNVSTTMQRAMREIKQGLARISSMISGTGWGWKKLDGNNGNIVSPFAPPLDPSVIERPAPFAATAGERHLSDTTLVPSNPSLWSAEQSDTSDMSLVVNIPSPVKDVTSASLSRRDQHPILTTSSIYTIH